LSIRRRVSPTTWLEVLVARDNLGRTIGYRDTVPAGFMDLNQSVIACAFLVGKGRENPRVSLRKPYVAGGPALFRLALVHEGPPHVKGGGDVSALVPGAVASVGYIIRTTKERILVRAQLRCNLIPPVGLGPIRRPFSGDDPAGSLPRTRINFTHIVIGVGIGLRI
jgi:hypothetical protein